MVNDPEYDLQHRSDSPIYDRDEPIERPFVWMEQSRHYQRTLVLEMIERVAKRLETNLCNTPTNREIKERLENYYQYLKFKS